MHKQLFEHACKTLEKAIKESKDGTISSRDYRVSVATVLMFAQVYDEERVEKIRRCFR